MCPYKFMHPSFGGREWGCRRCVKSWRCGRLSTWELVLGSLARSCWGSCDETHFTACISGGQIGVCMDTEWLMILCISYICYGFTEWFTCRYHGTLELMVSVCLLGLDQHDKARVFWSVLTSTCGGTEALFGHKETNMTFLNQVSVQIQSVLALKFTFCSMVSFYIYCNIYMGVS